MGGQMYDRASVEKMVGNGGPGMQSRPPICCPHHKLLHLLLQLLGLLSKDSLN